MRKTDPTRRRVLWGAAAAAGTLLGNAGALWAEAPGRSLRPKARPVRVSTRSVPDTLELVDRARLSGQVAFAVADARTGEMLEGRAPDMPLPPASVTKTVTTLYALRTLGGDHRFETRVLATGPVEDGVLKGDLVLMGGGDPTLDTDALSELAAGLKKAGLREVKGRFRIWDGALPHARAIVGDQPEDVAYNPAVSGISLNFNRVHFQWKRVGKRWNVTMDARTARFRPEVQVARMTVARRAAPIFTYTDGGDHEEWSVASGALGTGGARWLPVRKPALYAGEVLSWFARAQGLVLPAPERDTTQRPEGTTLARHRSGPLAEILRGMLKYSTNLTAEMVGMAATAQRTGQRPASMNASAEAMADWASADLGLSEARFLDHSGLDERTRISAGQLTRALARPETAKLLEPLLKTVHLRNSRGGKIRHHRLKVSAKTGTLYFVSALAGYVRAPDGTHLAFTIIAADTGRRKAIDTSIDGRPRGALNWNVHAKILQSRLIERWGTVFAG